MKHKVEFPDGLDSSSLGMVTKHRQLTPRLLEVTKLLALGYPDKQIAELLGVEYRTVGKHAGVIYKKLNVHTRTQLAHLALHNQWIKNLYANHNS